MIKFTIRVENIEVRGTEAIKFINEKLIKDLAETPNSLEVLGVTVEGTDSVFEVETNFHNPITVADYFTKFIRRRKRFIVARNEAEEVDETVIDCTGINFNNINDIHKVVETETLPEVIQGFIQSCTRFAFDQNTLILYRERKAVACASFFVAGGIAHIIDMGAGDVFQWDSIKGFEESQPVEVEEGADDVEVKKVVKAIQMIKENFELGMDKKDIKDLYFRAVQIYGKVIEDNIPQRIKDFIN